jgi:hypothetical protein
VTGVSPLVLGDNSLRRGPGCKLIQFATPSFQQLLQVSAFPNASEVEVFGRQNLTTVYRFAVHYEFSFYNDCLMWQHDLGDLMTSEGVLVVIFTGGGQREITGAWQDITPTPAGSSCFINFTFVGGAMT